MRARLGTAAALSLAFLAAAPGCGPSAEEEPAFQFGLAELEQTVAGDWAGTLRLTGKPDTTLALHLQHGAPGTQPACSNRTLAHTQCIDASTMRLDGTLTTADKAFTAAPVTGQFFVDGLVLSYGELTLTTESGLRLHVSYTTGAFATGDVNTADGAAAGTFTLKRP